MYAYEFYNNERLASMYYIKIHQIWYCLNWAMAGSSKKFNEYRISIFFDSLQPLVV